MSHGVNLIKCRFTPHKKENQEKCLKIKHFLGFEERKRKTESKRQKEKREKEGERKKALEGRKEGLRIREK